MSLDNTTSVDAIEAFASSQVGEDTSATTTSTETPSFPGSSQTTSQQVASETTETSSTPRTTEKSSPTTTPSTQTTQQTTQEDEKPGTPVDRFGEYQVDSKGNLLFKDGTLFAKAGREREIAQKVHRSLIEVIKPEIKRLQDHFAAREQQYQQQLSANNELSTMLAKNQWTSEHAVAGAAFLADYVKDPAATITSLIQEAASRNVDLSGIVGGALAGQVRALQEQLKTSLAPLNASQQAAQQQQQIEQEVIQEIEGFYNEFPLARMHNDAIDYAFDNWDEKQFGPPSMQKVWEAIVLSAEQHGLDVRQPLRGQTPKGKQSQQNVGGVTQASLPMGSSGGLQYTAIDNDDAGDTGNSVERFIRESMNELRNRR